MSKFSVGDTVTFLYGGQTRAGEVIDATPKTPLLIWSNGMWCRVLAKDCILTRGAPRRAEQCNMRIYMGCVLKKGHNGKHCT